MKFSVNVFLVIALACCLASPDSVAANVELDALPVTKILVKNGLVQTEYLSTSQADKARVTIIRDGSNYRWASRNNISLLKIEMGGYITYVSPAGSGYVRVLNPVLRRLRESIPVEKREPELEYLYVEHLVHQLGSVTYYGQ